MIAYVPDPNEDPPKSGRCPKCGVQLYTKVGRVWTIRQGGDGRVITGDLMSLQCRCGWIWPPKAKK